MAGDKRALRQKFLQARRSLAPEYRQEASRAMLSQLFALTEYRQAASVMGYASMADEVQLAGFLEHSLALKKTVGVPQIMARGLMAAARLPETGALVVGAYGILEVARDRRELLPPGTFELVLVPGVAFGKDGSRLGMGAGFYDRFLSEKEPQALHIALCFDCQLSSDIPMEAHDRRVDMLITETGCVDCRKAR